MWGLIKYFGGIRVTVLLEILGIGWLGIKVDNFGEIRV